VALGYAKDDIDGLPIEALASTTKKVLTDEMIAMVRRDGETAVNTKALLDEANTTAHGHSEITDVHIGVRKKVPMEKTKKTIAENTMRAWESYLATLEHALIQMEKSIEESVSVDAACTNEWCESVEEVVDELTEAIYSLNIPRWADPEQSHRVKTLKKKAREVYARYMQAAG
jgi:hydroxylamine reductase (hybrid-cluster protein)